MTRFVLVIRRHHNPKLLTPNFVRNTFPFDTRAIQLQLNQLLIDTTTLELHPNAHLIKGVICGYRVEEIETPLTRQARYLDKLVDELARGKAMEKILRSA